ncbi:diguanylate cyclase [Pedobacter yonginense]|uniref:Diguanylate cyclase n=1 Tax=Pedobacter yonginense TaxID=651869 RepID=A0A317ET27_9SPHI|nr:PAS domain S-box protein [Pedobacter yonginense]PWS28308.1 diguanylate cyclase [Pedobacter yonginense]
MNKKQDSAELKVPDFDLEYFFDLSPDLLCVAGYDGYFKKINPAVSKTLGYTDEELFASPINSFVHPDDQALTEKRRSSIREGSLLKEFENRYITKAGAIVWLSWTSIPIVRDQLVFAIAKDVTYRKRLEEYERVSAVLAKLNEEQRIRFNPSISSGNDPKIELQAQDKPLVARGVSAADQLFLNRFESLVKDHVGKTELSLKMISDGLAVSERNLFRQINRILGITPNRLVRIIRLHLAWEAIGSGKYRTIKEISNIAGFSSRGHFKKLFFEVYGLDVSELL